jgi:hypothetical protein
VWQLTTIVAWHYMHTSKMKKLGFIKKNKVFERITKASVEKVLLILIVDVKWLSLESRGPWIMTKALPTTCMKLNTHLRSMPTTHGMGIVWKFM